MRTRWNRAFAALTIILFLGAVVNFLDTRWVGNAFRSSALHVEDAARDDAKIRAEVIAAAVLFASPATDVQQRQLATDEESIRRDFAETITGQRSGAARRLLETSLADWQAIVTQAGPLGQPAEAAVRTAAVSAQAPKVLRLLDQAGSVDRAAVRHDLARTSSLEREGMAVTTLVALLALVVVARLARRLSSEIVRPIRMLRDSADHLTAGELDHRVVINRTDELGELAVSFNTMADAIGASQRILSREANQDSLTGLANRSAFRTRLGAMLARPERRAGREAVLFVDLDDFKDVNDSMGHAAGDQVLRAIAGRLNDAVRPADLVARVGGDEFAVLVDGISTSDLAFTVAERVVASLAEPVNIAGSKAHVGASVGLAMRQDHSTIDMLMGEADRAMYAAKAKGKHRVECSDPSVQTRLERSRWQ